MNKIILFLIYFFGAVICTIITWHGKSISSCHIFPVYASNNRGTQRENHFNVFNFGNRKPSGDISDEKIMVTNMTRTMMMMTMMTVIFSGVLTR